VRRFQGEPLPPQPKIAVIANDALGNYVVSTPLIQMLKSKYLGADLHYFSGHRVQELWSKDPLIDYGFPLHGSEPAAAHDAARGPYDLVVNIEWSAWPKCFATLIASDETYVCGPALSPDGRTDWPFPTDQTGDLWRDQNWISEQVTQQYSFLDSGFIGEFFCRLAYLDGPVPRYAVPSAPPPIQIPDVLIATAASLPDKLWPTEKWIETLAALKAKGLTIGLVGAKPKEQKQFWQGGSGEEEIVASGHVEDLRGRLTLPEVVGALGKANRVLTLDNGILHLAASTGTPTVGLYRHGIHRLWAPPYDNLTILTPGENRSVAEIEVQDVLRAL
jgi:heptosyltransferase III